MNEKGISVNFVIKNGIIQGYPFWESLKSCLEFADEVVISEGCSTDGTRQFIDRFTRVYSDCCDFRVYEDDWDRYRSGRGELIAKISDLNMRRCRYEWVYYLQADEVLHPDNSWFVRDIAMNHPEFNSVSFRFAHFIGSWEPLPKNGGAYNEAIRFTRNRKDIRFLGDAWNFQGAVKPICPAGLSPKPVYHLGWVFPQNIDHKKLGHAALYSNMKEYQKGIEDARRRIEQGHDYKAIEKTGEFDDYPPGVKRLFGMVAYQLPEEAFE